MSFHLTSDLLSSGALSIQSMGDMIESTLPPPESYHRSTSASIGLTQSSMASGPVPFSMLNCMVDDFIPVSLPSDDKNDANDSSPMNSDEEGELQEQSNKNDISSKSDSSSSSSSGNANTNVESPKLNMILRKPQLVLPKELIPNEREKLQQRRQKPSPQQQQREPIIQVQQKPEIQISQNNIGLKKVNFEVQENDPVSDQSIMNEVNQFQASAHHHDNSFEETRISFGQQPQQTAGFGTDSTLQTSCPFGSSAAVSSAPFQFSKSSSNSIFGAGNAGSSLFGNTCNTQLQQQVTGGLFGSGSGALRPPFHPAPPPGYLFGSANNNAAQFQQATSGGSLFGGNLSTASSFTSTNAAQFPQASHASGLFGNAPQPLFQAIPSNSLFASQPGLSFQQNQPGGVLGNFTQQNPNNFKFGFAPVQSYSGAFGESSNLSGLPACNPTPLLLAKQMQHMAEAMSAAAAALQTSIELHMPPPALHVPLVSQERGHQQIYDNYKEEIPNCTMNTVIDWRRLLFDKEYQPLSKSTLHELVQLQNQNGSWSSSNGKVIQLLSNLKILALRKLLQKSGVQSLGKIVAEDILDSIITTVALLSVAGCLQLDLSAIDCDYEMDKSEYDKGVSLFGNLFMSTIVQAIGKATNWLKIMESHNPNIVSRLEVASNSKIFRKTLWKSLDGVTFPLKLGIGNK